MNAITFSTKALVAYFGLILYVSSVGVIDKNLRCIKHVSIVVIRV